MKLSTFVYLALLAALAIAPRLAFGQPYNMPAEMPLQGYGGYPVPQGYEGYPPMGAYPEMGVYPAGDAFGGEVVVDDSFAEALPYTIAPFDERYWGGLQFLTWWRQGRSLPALVTTSPPGTPRAVAGVLPDAEVLYGNERVGGDLEIGGAIYLGGWMDALHEVGVGGRFYALEASTTAFSIESSATGVPTIARPFFNVILDAEAAALIAHDDPVDGPIRAGRIDISTSNEVYGGDVFLRVNWDRGPNYSLDLIGGYQYTHVSDSLVIRSQSVSLDAGALVPIGTTFNAQESFVTRNDFNGGLVGLMGEARTGRWRFAGSGRVGFGDMHQEVAIAGRTVVVFPAPGPVDRFAGDLYAQPTNIGTRGQNRFAFAPEAQASVGYFINPNIEVSVGYNFLYWTSVALAGNQIDRRINPTQFGGAPLVGPANPSPIIRTSDFWAQGLTFGVNARY